MWLVDNTSPFLWNRCNIWRHQLGKKTCLVSTWNVKKLRSSWNNLYCKGKSAVQSSISYHIRAFKKWNILIVPTQTCFFYFVWYFKKRKFALLKRVRFQTYKCQKVSKIILVTNILFYRLFLKLMTWMTKSLK